MKENEENKNFIIANASTNSFTPAYAATGSASFNISMHGFNDFKKVVNLQLESWKKAKREFSILKQDNNSTPEKRILILSLLGESLASLFGANYEKSVDVPSLKNFIDITFPKEKKWKLADDDKVLYEKFLELDDYYKDVAKHFGRMKLDKALNITDQKLEEFMETTRKVWLWFMGKFFGGESNIPPDQLTEFSSINVS